MNDDVILPVMSIRSTR